MHLDNLFFIVFGSDLRGEEKTQKLGFVCAYLLLMSSCKCLKLSIKDPKLLKLVFVWQTGMKHGAIKLTWDSKS